MHYLENPLYSLEFVFLLVSFSDLFRIKSNRRNRTPKQQQWVANFSVTTNILPYLTVQIENIFCCCCLCISSSINLKEGQKWSACWFLDTPPPPPNCLLLLPWSPSWPMESHNAQGCSGPWGWLWSHSTSQGPDLQTLLATLCGISAELGFPKQTWFSHLMNLPRAGEAQSHCIF